MTSYTYQFDMLYLKHRTISPPVKEKKKNPTNKEENPDEPKE